MILEEEDYLEHYGVLRRSGRYPWGSGGPENASNKGFLDYVAEMRKQGISDVDIAKGMGITTTQLRAASSIAKNETKQADIAMAQRLKDKGMSNSAIGQRMGKNESSVRALLAPGAKDKAEVLTATSKMLKDQIAEKKFLDIGTGVEQHIGVSETKLKTAVAELQEQGYKVHYVKVAQLGTGKQTTVKVLTAPDISYSEVYKNRDNIKQFTEFSEDGGRSFLGLMPPLSVSSKRIAITYADQGGSAADGVMYIRRGVEDISIGSNRYAQVRMMVDGTHYLKGMAVYKDDMPPGVDVIFNTSKSNTGNKHDAMKELKKTKEGEVDPDNPFGAVVRQRISLDPKTGKPFVTSAMNIVGTKEGSGEEGSWDTWSRNLPSQFLSKQSPTLAKGQLDVTFERKKKEFDEILGMTNPVVRKKLLESFADDVDSSAVHLKAAALPRQSTHVILPLNSMKENEVYAPNFKNGERVALVRFPHGGTFEIPELTVNNNHPQAKKLLGRTADAIGINTKVAQRLSGADFDGDTVLVIPNDKGHVKSTPALEKLKGFDPQSAYPGYEGMPKMNARTKGVEMGVVSNLITDMTIRGASTDEMARAVKHSMVVIDAEKHGLNYKQSAIDNGISQLKAKYQGSSRSGASTLISRASAEVRVPNRKERIDPATGKKIFTPTGESFVNREGVTIVKKFKSKKLAETSDAHTLSSGTKMERIYADHSNRLKAMANDARKVMVNTKPAPWSESAKKVYSKEVTSLNAKLNLAKRNRPLERQAQIFANANVRAKQKEYPDMDPADLKKIKSQALAEARTRTGAKKQQIVITDSEWAAIQAGAISGHRLSDILNNADLERVKQLATPKTEVLMTSAKKNRAEAMLKSGFTQADVAAALGVSLTTLKTSIG